MPESTEKASKFCEILLKRRYFCDKIITVMMQEIYRQLKDGRNTLVKAVFSSPQGEVEFTRVLVRPVQLKNAAWQAERFCGTKVFHLNLTDEGLEKWLNDEGRSYRQIDCAFLGQSVTFFKRGERYKRTERANRLKTAPSQTNNRQKEYLLSEGEAIPALVDLGVFTADYKVKTGKYDKFKQINRFVELVDDNLSKFGKEEVTVIDFGCGKSYLTFILYYYLAVKKGRRARIIGYDLKEDVVAHCNEIAQKYGYSGLQFFVNDVTKGKLYEGAVDMVVTLHACDIATDYALEFAIKRGAEFIFSVPCCQHEVNSSIQKGGDFDILLADGLYKERFSALLTDGVRTELLRQFGYAVDVVEFVDFAHSPKNIMLRARKKKGSATPDFSRVEHLMQTYRFTQRLYQLLK